MKFVVELNTDWINSRDLILHYVSLQECPHCGSNHEKLPVKIRGKFFKQTYYVECPSTEKSVDLIWG